MGKRPPESIVADWPDTIDPRTREIPPTLYRAYCRKATGYETILEAFARSDRGERVYNLHAHGNVPITTLQRDAIPIQLDFLQYAADEHEPDTDESPSRNYNTPNIPNV